MGESLKQYKKVQRYNLLIGVEIILFILYLVTFSFISGPVSTPRIIREFIHPYLFFVFIGAFIFLLMLRSKAKKDFVIASTDNKPPTENPDYYAIIESHAKHKLILFIIFASIATFLGIIFLIAFIDCHDHYYCYSTIFFGILFLPPAVIFAIIAIVDLSIFFNARSELKELKEKLEIRKQANERKEQINEQPKIQ